MIRTHYEEYGDEGHNLGDPAIIHDCGLKGWVLLTGDRTWFTHARVKFAKAKIAVFVTTDNNEGPGKWGPRIIAARSDIMRELARRQKPFTGVISGQGRVSHVRLYEHGRWKLITMGRRIHPMSTDKKESGAVEIQAIGSGFNQSQTAADGKAED